MLGMPLWYLTDKLLVITYKFIKLNVINNVLQIKKFFKQYVVMHSLSLVKFTITFSSFKGLCILS